jgi:hypothetical protein
MNPWVAILIVVGIVVVLSAFSATKKFAYWIGGIALLILILPQFRKMTGG